MVDPILRAPLNVEWEITKACNLRCKHCYTAAGQKEPEELTTQEVFSIIDLLDAVGVSDITISGGEPLLRRDLEEIMAYLFKKEIPSFLYTNGLLLSRERQHSLFEAGVRSLSLSLNGTRKETHNFVHGADTFDTVLKRISQLKDNGFLVQALYTLMKMNLQEAMELPSFLDEICIDSLCVYPFYPAGRGAHHLSAFEVPGEELYQVIEELLTDDRIFLGGCLRGIFGKSLVKGSPCAKLMCLVTSEGRLRPCNFLPFQTKESLLHTDIYTLWKSPIFERVRKWQNVVEMNCSTCEYVKTCRSSCMAFHLPFLSEEEINTFEKD